MCAWNDIAKEMGFFDRVRSFSVREVVAEQRDGGDTTLACEIIIAGIGKPPLLFEPLVEMTCMAKI